MAWGVFAENRFGMESQTDAGNASPNQVFQTIMLGLPLLPVDRGSGLAPWFIGKIFLFVVSRLAFGKKADRIAPAIIMEALIKSHDGR